MKADAAGAACGEDDINPTKLTEVQEMLHSLSESINRIQFLKGKWLLINSKVANLQSRLSEVPISSENQLFSDLLWSLSAACSSAASLAAVCQILNPPGGKLRTQNDVDSISAKLDSHINDLETLFKCGAFTPTAVRASAQNLTTRLQIGSSAAKAAALDSLLGFLQEDEKNALIAMAQGMIPILANLLNPSSSTEIKEKSIAAIAKISIIDSSKHILLSEGLPLLNNLLRLLESCSIFAKEKSCIVLRILINSKANARAITSRGGISSLIQICQEGTPNLQVHAAAVLRNLSVFNEIREDFLQENAVTAMLALCKSGSLLAQEHSIGCLYNLVSEDDKLKLFIAQQGIESIKIFWDSATSVQSLLVLINLVRSLSLSPNVAHLLISNGFITRVVGVLDCEASGVRVAAAEAVYNLASAGGNKMRKEMGETGCILQLIRMLEGKCVEEKKAALKALSMLMSYAGNRGIFRKEGKGIVLAVEFLSLSPLMKGLDQRYCLGLLGCLVQDKKCRKEMVNAGIRECLKKLVEKDGGVVEGAEKLLDCVGHGKVWGVFARY